jgi:hypothetical protein
VANTPSTIKLTVKDQKLRIKNKEEVTKNSSKLLKEERVTFGNDNISNSSIDLERRRDIRSVQEQRKRSKRVPKKILQDSD